MLKEQTGKLGKAEHQEEKKECLRKVNQTWLANHVECFIIKILPACRSCRYRHQKVSAGSRTLDERILVGLEAETR